jgi:hypothetical protein
VINVIYDVHLDYMLEEVLPAIKAHFPTQHSREIQIGIQQDNVPHHFTSKDAMWIARINHKAEDIWHFRLLEQPPNLPDTNTLDLGFFASIQSIQ